jgi:Killing trait
MANETDSINDQIRDSVEQINQLLQSGDSSTVRAMTYQIMAHSIALSLYNTVHQQQQMYILQNAVTTAAVQDALKSNPAEAIKLSQQVIADSDLTTTISRLKQLMDELNDSYGDFAAKSGASQNTAKSKRKSA